MIVARKENDLVREHEDEEVELLPLQSRRLLLLVSDSLMLYCGYGWHSISDRFLSLTGMVVVD